MIPEPGESIASINSAVAEITYYLHMFGSILLAVVFVLFIVFFVYRKNQVSKAKRQGGNMLDGVEIDDLGPVKASGGVMNSQKEDISPS